MTKTKTLKRAMLMSLFALIICVSMFVGSTFAWFTDSVTSVGNIIKSGTLDVTMEWADGKTDPTNTTWTDASTDAIFNSELWEPGYVEVRHIKIANAGTLALKYQLNILANGAVSELADVIDVYYVDPAVKVENRDALANVEKIGTLSEVLAKVSTTAAGELKAGENHTITLALKMQETAGNEYQDKSIGSDFSVQLLATQLTYESDSFDNQYDVDAKPVVVYTAEDLADALTSEDELISVILGADVDLPISSLGAQTPGSGEYKLGGENTKAIDINLNGKLLNITTTYWSAIGAKNANATITIKNGSMTSSQPTGTWNSYDLTFANCNYAFENVVFEKAVALSNEGKAVNMKNVTINETHDYYALWITAEGQNVSIDGLTVNSLGRGIKIDKQYVSAPAKVTLSISNATFNTTKKAAIVVKSEAGANIALSNVNIAAVAADPFNAVWVDEDASSYAGLVTVNGGTKIVEGSAEAPKANSVAADTTVLMKNVITSGGQTVIDNKGTINLSDAPSLNGGDVVINGGTVVTTSKNYTGLQHAGEVTYNNVTFNGSTFLYGDKVVFNNCTFNLTTNYVWTYGAKEVEFNNCTFNTNGKAILVYKEDGVFSGVVTINGCEFNATASAFAGGIPSQPCAAVEIDSSLITGNYTVNFTGENVVDEDFSGLVRVKKGSEKNNVTINGATPVTLS